MPTSRFETLEWLGQPYGFNELHVIATNAWDKAWAEKVVNSVKDKAERSGYTIPTQHDGRPGATADGRRAAGNPAADGRAGPHVACS